MEKRKGSTLKQEYQLRFSETEEYRKAVWKILCADFFQKHVPKDSTILELASGWGEFINHIEADNKFAMDLNPETKNHLTDNIVFLSQDCSTRWQLDDESLDIVFTSNFLEHLPTKESIEHTISETNRCLKEHGKIICLGPNIKYLPGAYWDFWDHCVPITEMSLSELLKMRGFEIDVCIPRFLPYSMSTGSTPPLILVRIYLKFSLIWPIVGKQFLVIAKKLTT